VHGKLVDFQIWVKALGHALVQRGVGFATALAEHFLQSDPCFKHLVWGLLASAALLLGTSAFEHTDAGHFMDNQAYMFLLRGMPEFSDVPLPQVFDINQIPGTEKSPTSRKELKALIEALADKAPRAIAIDIDFSPSADRLMTPEDPDFFEFCLRMTRDRGIPIFLGVNRTRNEEPKRWLGFSRYQELAAAGFARNDDPRLSRWVTSGHDPNRLPTLGEALAHTYQTKPMEPPRWIAWALNPTDEVLVNYSKLRQMESESKPLTNASSVQEYTDQLQNRLILLGDVRLATDKVQVPGQRDLVPGVFAMASLAYTLALAPFFEFTFLVRIALDAGISLVLVIGLYRICRTRTNVAREKRARRFLIGTTVVVLVAGFILVRLFGIMWLDFLLVPLALLLHPGIKEWLRGRFKLPRKIPNVPG
jgi:CHASE2 domain-containing sensor protein